MTLFLLFVSAYLLGNLLTGSIISKIFYRKKIHFEGSGNPGARNAGRLFGKKAFIATFLGDAGKGAAVVLAAKWFGFGFSLELLVLVVCVFGHIYPVLFRFRGGKGVSTFIGGFLVFNPVLVALLAGVFLVFYPFNKSFTVSGMIAILLLPVGVLVLGYEFVAFMITCLLSGLVLFAHRENLKQK